MPKLGMEPIRKRQVIEATMRCIHEDGMARTSLQRVARNAGITSGLILHYFDDKEGLFEAVYRDLYKRLAGETVSRLKQSATARERFFAVLEAQVCDEMVEPRVVATWFALAAKAPETPSLARLERANARRMNSNLIHILKRLGLSRVEAAEIAEELLALIYGLWTNLAHKTIADAEAARTVLYRYVRARVPLSEL
ncbi:MAG: transcriptional regulator BetI [Pseudomonadota bacterium]